jgi:hypothetical protein
MTGKTTADSDKLKTNAKGTLITEANRFEIAGVIPSEPRPLLTFKPRKAYLTSSSKIAIAFQKHRRRTAVCVTLHVGILKNLRGLFFKAPSYAQSTGRISNGIDTVIKPLDDTVASKKI